ncbi:MAG: FG-GAP repeat protein [Planctomycetes bacterium]|nr:FG-GAP repeat protein [Planctomycetota bacterium]
MHAPSVLRFALLLGLAASVSSQMTVDTVYGAHAFDQFGSTVVSIGDVDGDLVADFVVGSPGASPGGQSSAGSVSVFSGRTRALLYTIDGTDAGAQFGLALAGGADFDHDGWPDFAVGAPFQSVVTSARVYSGPTGALLDTFSAPTTLSQWASGLCFPGDLDGDGWQDLAVGAPAYSAPVANSGLVRVYSGQTGSVLWQVTGPLPESAMGRSLAAIGDWNLDGVPDIAVGLEGYSNYRGRVEIRSGTTGALLSSSEGVSAFEFYGFALAALDDVDGDGRKDLVAGGYGATVSMVPSTGRLRVIQGGTGSVLYSLDGPDLGGEFAYSLAAVADADGDGRGDFLVGQKYDFTGSDLIGRAYLYSGATHELLWSLTEGDAPLEWLGHGLSDLGDVDDDGYREYLVGAPGSAVTGSFAGAVRVVRAAVEQEDLGFGGPGDTHATVYGYPLATGTLAQLLVTNAPPNQTMYLLLSLAQQPLPFKGGTIVPQITTAFIVGLYSFGGELDGQVPGGGGPADLFVQFITVDPSQPLGFDFSNALRLEYLP